MKKIVSVALVFVLPFIFFHADSLAADKKIDRLYELYNSTSTPAIYKDRLGSILKSLERRLAVIEAAREKRSKSAGPSALKTAFPRSADASFQAGEVYCFPNPAKKTTPTTLKIISEDAQWLIKSLGGEIDKAHEKGDR